MNTRVSTLITYLNASEKQAQTSTHEFRRGRDNDNAVRRWFRQRRMARDHAEVVRQMAQDPEYRQMRAAADPGKDPTGMWGRAIDRVVTDEGRTLPAPKKDLASRLGRVFDSPFDREGTPHPRTQSPAPIRFPRSLRDALSGAATGRHLMKAIGPKRPNVPLELKTPTGESIPNGNTPDGNPAKTEMQLPKK